MVSQVQLSKTDDACGWLELSEFDEPLHDSIREVSHVSELFDVADIDLRSVPVIDLWLTKQHNVMLWCQCD